MTLQNLIINLGAELVAYQTEGTLDVDNCALVCLFGGVRQSRVVTVPEGDEPASCTEIWETRIGGLLLRHRAERAATPEEIAVVEDRQPDMIGARYFQVVL